MLYKFESSIRSIFVWGLKIIIAHVKDLKQLSGFLAENVLGSTKVQKCRQKSLLSKVLVNTVFTLDEMLRCYESFKKNQKSLKTNFPYPIGTPCVPIRVNPWQKHSHNNAPYFSLASKTPRVPLHNQNTIRISSKNTFLHPLAFPNSMAWLKLALPVAEQFGSAAVDLTGT